ncbi:MAG TPA: 2-C-methyl-D-erythritol 4-phosphate cytidylyltransferase [Elusimicrobiota bacterium]|nr:2-C-methyl-D-erythritol 4-phosphate cytidylyltransferase [Elusimicrobiota bacterium]
MRKSPVGVVVVAGGRGRRFGASRPKQFLPLNGHPLVYWSLLTLQRVTEIYGVVLVLPAEHVEWGSRFVQKNRFDKVLAVVSGGAERVHSVKNGLSVLPAECETVLIHDAARPLAPPSLFSKVAAESYRWGAAVAAIPVSDTLKKSDRSGFVNKTVPREGLWAAQTPQGFRRRVAERVFRGRLPVVTDDVQLAERRGLRVKLVKGSTENIKVTLPADLEVCRNILKRRRQ